MRLLFLYLLISSASAFASDPPCAPVRMGLVQLSSGTISLTGDDYLVQNGLNSFNLCGEGTINITNSFTPTSMIVTIQFSPDPGPVFGYFDPDFMPNTYPPIMTGGDIVIFTEIIDENGNKYYPSEADIKNTIAHELAHAMGWNHTGCAGSIMSTPDVEPLPHPLTSHDCWWFETTFSYVYEQEEDTACDPSSTCLRKVGEPCCDNHSLLVIDMNQNGFAFGAAPK